MKSISSGHQLESPRRKRQLLDGAYPPLDVRQAVPFSPKAPNSDHVRLLVHRQDLIESSCKPDRHLAGATGQVKKLTLSAHPRIFGQPVQQSWRVGRAVTLIVRRGANVEIARKRTSSVMPSSSRDG
jgi:hypothetical protein